MNLKEINNCLRNSNPSEIISWALSQAKRPILTTNFGPYEVAILHAVSSLMPKIPVVWCDSGYNTSDTYKHAEKLIEKLNLQVDLYVPKQSTAHRNVTLGIPEIDTPEHNLFTQQVKLEPFSRAMKNHNPDVWFTNIRKDQTAFRANLDIVTEANGVLKIAPFFHFSEQELDQYLLQHRLETEKRYYDPTKALATRECGLHT